jgi:serine/threonine-protein kinase
MVTPGLLDQSYRNIWIYDWKRDHLFPITFAKGVVCSPEWSPDGKHLIFSSTGVGVSGPGVYWVHADGSGQPERLLDPETLGLGTTIYTRIALSPGGKRIAFAGNGKISTAALNWTDPEHPKAAKAEPFPTGPGRASEPAFSPDGRWIAYLNDQSGQAEVYVAPFPGPGGKWMISSGGGFFPVWSRNGREIFYQSSKNGRLFVVTYVTKAGAFEANPPRLWVDRQLQMRNGGLAPDGQHFVVAIPPADESGAKSPTHVVFLLNFFDELRRRVPVK